MTLSKFAIAGVLVAGLGLASAAPADAQVIYTAGSAYPGGTFYVQPTAYVVPIYTYGYRSFPSYRSYPSYGYANPAFSAYRPWYPPFGGYRSVWGNPGFGYPGFGSPAFGYSRFGFAIVR